MQHVLSFIWQLSLYASVLGFWPALYLIFSVWGYYSREGSELKKPSKRIGEWYPVIVYPWVVSVGVFLAIFLYVIFVAARR